MLIVFSRPKMVSVVLMFWHRPLKYLNLVMVEALQILCQQPLQRELLSHQEVLINLQQLQQLLQIQKISFRVQDLFDRTNLQRHLFPMLADLRVVRTKERRQVLSHQDPVPEFWRQIVQARLMTKLLELVVEGLERRNSKGLMIIKGLPAKSVNQIKVALMFFQYCLFENHLAQKYLQRPMNLD